MATGSLDGTAKVWDLKSPGNPKELYSFTHDTPIRWVDISPDGQLLAATTADGYVRVYHTQMDVGQLMKMAEHRARGELAFEDCRRYLPEDQCRSAP